MARLYANENFPLPAVYELQKLGHDVLTSLEAGKANQSLRDDQVLEFATSERRALFTLNRKHFVRLHQIYPDNLGIIVCSFDSDFVALANRVNSVIHHNEPLNGKLIRVDRPG